MSLVRVRATGEVLLRSQFAATLPNVSLAENLSQYEYDTYGFDPVTEVEQPAITEYQLANYLGAVQQADGTWAQGWEVVSKPQADIDAIDAAKAAKNRDDARASRQAQVDAIQVTTASGKTFDGDETSQDRMSRACVAMRSPGSSQTSTNWILADNTQVSVTVDELEEALRLAGTAQTNIWNPIV